MAHHKCYLFETEEQEFATGCKVLSHPARHRIVTVLRKHNHLTLTQLREHIPLAESTIAQHIQILRTAGILNVAGNSQGEGGYVLDHAALKRLEEVMNRFWEGD